MQGIGDVKHTTGPCFGDAERSQTEQTERKHPAQSALVLGIQDEDHWSSLGHEEGVAWAANRRLCPRERNRWCRLQRRGGISEATSKQNRRTKLGLGLALGIKRSIES